VEISDHPLRPGGRYRLYVSQGGPLKVNSLAVSLVSTESARYRQGTNAHTDTKMVRREVLFLNEGFQIERGMPFEARTEFSVPTGVMHSFEGGNNKVEWKLLVNGDIAGWPDFEHEFPVLVLPASDPMEDSSSGEADQDEHADAEDEAGDEEYYGDEDVEDDDTH